MAFGSLDNDAAVTFMVSAGLVYEIIAACCSSPQTTELNRHRVPTLKKWVNIGLIQAAGFVAIAVMLDKKRWPAAFGGGLAGVVMWWMYDYAAKCGLESDEPGTEG